MRPIETHIFVARVMRVTLKALTGIGFVTMSLHAATAGSAQAIKRCEEMSHNKNVCKAPLPSAPPASQPTVVAAKA